MIDKVLFTKTQTRLLKELKGKFEQAWQQELNGVLAVIYDELGLAEKFRDGKHRFEIQPGFSGVNVSNIEPTPIVPKGKPKPPSAK